MSRDLSGMMLGSARGSVRLLVGQVVTAVISALTVMWMARYLGATSYGEYNIALLPVSISLLFQDLGMNNSLTRYCALYRSEKKFAELKTVVMTGFVFSIFTSVIISGFLYFFADFIASAYLQRPEVAILIQASALAVLGGGGLLTTIQAILVGYEMMGLRSVTQIVWSIIRSILTVILLLIGMGTLGAMISYTLSQLVGGLFGIVLCFFFIKFYNGGKIFDWSVLKELLRYGFPLSVGSLLNGIQAQMYNSIMIIYAATDLIGNYSAAKAFWTIIALLLSTITTTLFPLFSKFKKDDPQLKLVFRTAVKYTSMITLPIVFLIVALSGQISGVIYGTGYPFVAGYLALLILNYSWEGLGGVSLSSVILGLGNAKVELYSTVCTFIAGTILVLVLGPIYGIPGIILTMLLAPRVGWVYEIVWAKRNLDLTVDWSSSAKIFVTVLISFFSTYLTVTSLHFSDLVELMIGGFVFMFVLFIVLPLSGALTRTDFVQISFVLNGMGPIGRFTIPILNRLKALARK
jgi:O-antigen/teichoic acid export membrane protein